MVSRNWKIFEAKFQDKTEKFEWFCYLLFCREFNKKQGIFGFINQADIEQEPIIVGKRVIGFQSRFWTDSLTKHKKEIIKKIKEVNRDYPDLNELHWYAPSLFGQNNSNKHNNTQKDIETKAEELGIQLIWKDDNYFKSEEVCLKNEDISSYFFQLDGTFLDNLNFLKNHAQSILSTTDYSIKKNDIIIKRDNNSYIQKLTISTNKIFIIYGEGGCGKTALIKEFFDLNSQVPYFCTEAQEINNCRTIDDILFNCPIEKLISGFANETKKFFILDSAEKLNYDDKKHIELTNKLFSAGWSIVYTTRGNYLEKIISLFDPSDIEIINIQNFEEKLLIKDLKNNNIIIPDDLKLLNLLRNPFYLSFYVKNISNKNKLTLNQFKDNLWEMITAEAEPTFLKIVEEKIKTNCYYIDITHIDSNELKILTKSGIISRENSNYFITHDIFEELAIEKIINQLFNSSDAYDKFVSNLDNNSIVRKIYRNWLKNKLEIDDNLSNEFSNQIIEYVAKHVSDFKKISDTIISILSSKKSEILFTHFKYNLISNNLNNLLYIQELLRVACKKTDEKFFILSQNPIMLDRIYFDVPDGSGWSSFISFIYKNIEQIKISKINIFFDSFLDWTAKNKTGQETKMIGQLLYDYVTDSNEQDIEKAYLLISNSAEEIKEKLISIFNKTLKSKYKNNNKPYIRFIKKILSGNIKFLNIFKIKEFTNSLLDLMYYFWTEDLNTSNKHHSFYEINNSSSLFGIDSEISNFIFYPSPFQTPLYILLCVNYKKTINFIIRFINDSVEKYAKNCKNEIEIINVTIDGCKKQIYYNDELWCSYRGLSGITPYLFQSILMALEKHLLERSHNENFNLEKELLNILKQTNSVALVSIITIITISEYKTLYNIGKELLVKEFILADIIRQTKEIQLPSLYKIGHNPNYIRERLETCDQVFRKKTLEDIFVWYQQKLYNEETIEEVNKRRSTIYHKIDASLEDLEKGDLEESDKLWKLRLESIDFRKYKITKTCSVNGVQSIFFEPTLSKESEDYINERGKIIDKTFPYAQLKIWIDSTIKNNDNDESYKKSKYTLNPNLAAEELKQLKAQLTIKNNQSFYLINSGAYIKGIACLILYYHGLLTGDNFEFCKNGIIELIESVNYDCDVVYNCDFFHCVSALPVLLSSKKINQNDYSKIKFLLLVSLFIRQNNNDYKTQSLKFIRSFLPKNELELLIETYLNVAIKWENHLKHIHNVPINKINISDTSIYKFLEADSYIINQYRNNVFNKFKNIDCQSLSLNYIYTSLCLIDNKIDEYQYLLEQLSARGLYLLNNSNSNEDYYYELGFIKKITEHCFENNNKLVLRILNKFIDEFKGQESYSYFFDFLIAYAVDNKKVDDFWNIWSLFTNQFITLFKECKLNERTIKTYLIISFCESTHNSYNLVIFTKERKALIKNMFYKIQNTELSIFYLSYLLYNPASNYLNDGITWLSDLITNNPENKANFRIDFLEEDIKRYVQKNSQIIKIDKRIKQKVLTIIEYLIKKGSTIAYRIRDDIV